MQFMAFFPISMCGFDFMSVNVTKIIFVTSKRSKSPGIVAPPLSQLSQL